MLTIKIESIGNKSEEVIYDVNQYFDLYYELDWLKDEYVREMIRDVDSNRISDFEDQTIIISPIFGVITPDRLSGSVKTLILLYMEGHEEIFNISTCGDNCAKWIQDIGDKKDITVRLGYAMRFDFDNGFSYYSYNNKRIVSTFDEYLCEAVDEFW